MKSLVVGMLRPRRGRPGVRAARLQRLARLPSAGLRSSGPISASRALPRPEAAGRQRRCRWTACDPARAPAAPARRLPAAWPRALRLWGGRAVHRRPNGPGAPPAGRGDGTSVPAESLRRSPPRAATALRRRAISEAGTGFSLPAAPPLSLRLQNQPFA